MSFKIFPKSNTRTFFLELKRSNVIAKTKLNVRLSLLDSENLWIGSYCFISMLSLKLFLTPKFCTPYDWSAQN